MQALILAGGEGTRLRPLTETVPKTVLPLAGRPFTAYTIDWLERHGVDEVVLSCGYLAEEMREVARRGNGSDLTFAVEPRPLGTAGAIKFCESMLAERFFVLNGDVLADLDLGALLAQHESAGARATIALHPVDDPTSYGLVRRSENGEITEFVEKPDPGEIDTDEINAGAYLLEHSVLDLIPPEREVSIERETFQELVGQGLYGKRLDGYWVDIGTPERFRQASWDILERRVETVIGEAIGPDGLVVAPEAAVDPGAEVHAPALIDSGVMIGAGAKVGPRAVIGRGSVIGAGASVTDSILFDDCRVGAGATLSDGILSAGAEVPPDVHAPPGIVAGASEVVEEAAKA